MNEVLSSEEIEQLLMAISNSNEAEEKESDKRKIKIYDFMRQDLVTKSEIHKIYNLFEKIKTFKDGRVHVASVDQLTVKEFARCTPLEEKHDIFSIDGFNVLCNFYGDKNKNQNVKNDFKLMLFKIFESKVKHEGTSCYDDNYNNDTGVCVTYEYNKNDTDAMLNVFMTKDFVKKFFKDEIKYKIDCSDVKVPISVLLGNANIKISEMLNIKEGSIIELDKLAGEPVEVFSSDKKIADAEVVCIGEKFGIRIL